MAISQTEAASALRDVEQTTLRSAQWRAYGHASPHLLLWGAIWILGYGAMGFLPAERWGLIWLPLDLIGFAGSTALGMRARAQAPAAAIESGAFHPVPMIVSILFVTLFVVSTYVVFRPVAPEPYLVFPALVVGLVYVLLGAWKMQRLAWIGAAVFVLTMAGFLFLKPWLALWIAAVGGGGLVLGGLWLRKV